MSDPKVEYCDIVMKGGVTSGIVYPPAISELAKRFALQRHCFESRVSGLVFAWENSGNETER